MSSLSLTDTGLATVSCTGATGVINTTTFTSSVTQHPRKKAKLVGSVKTAKVPGSQTKRTRQRYSSARCCSLRASLP